MLIRIHLLIIKINSLYFQRLKGIYFINLTEDEVKAIMYSTSRSDSLYKRNQETLSCKAVKAFLVS